MHRKLSLGTNMLVISPGAWSLYIKLAKVCVMARVRSQWLVVHS